MSFRARFIACEAILGMITSFSVVAGNTVDARFDEQHTMNQTPSAEPGRVVQGIQEALSIADNALQTLGPQHEFVLLADRTIERPFGWVCFYVPKRFQASGNPNDLVPGNGPLVVYRANGRTEYLSSSVAPAQAIAGLERRLAAGRP